MLDVLGDIASLIFQQFTSIWNLYTTSAVLSGFFVLWILDHLFHIFDILKR